MESAGHVALINPSGGGEGGGGEGGGEGGGGKGGESNSACTHGSAPPRMPHTSTYVENKLAQASASWRSGGSSQRQITREAAPSFGQPWPIDPVSGPARPIQALVSTCGSTESSNRRAGAVGMRLVGRRRGGAEACAREGNRTPHRRDAALRACIARRGRSRRRVSHRGTACQRGLAVSRLAVEFGKRRVRQTDKKDPQRKRD